MENEEYTIRKLRFFFLCVFQLHSWSMHTAWLLPDGVGLKELRMSQRAVAVHTAADNSGLHVCRAIHKNPRQIAPITCRH
jgi:hypothetical protein